MIERPPLNFERIRGNTQENLTNGFEQQKKVNEHGKQVANLNKTSHINIGMQQRDSKFQLEIEKEKHRELILLHQSPSEISQRLNGHKLDNPNLKSFLNLKYLNASK